VSSVCGWEKENRMNKYEIEETIIEWDNGAKDLIDRASKSGNNDLWMFNKGMRFALMLVMQLLVEEDHERRN
jgi:hypothetical protein